MLALDKSYGSKETAKAAKSIGQDIGQLLQYGMQTQNKELIEKATKWSEIIKKNTEKNPPKVKPTLDPEAKTALKEKVGGIVGIIKAKAKFAEGYPKNLKTYVEEKIIPNIKSKASWAKDTLSELKTKAQDSVTPKIYADAGWKSGALDSMKNEAERVHPHITADVTATGLEAIGRKIKEAIKGTITLTSGGTSVGTVSVSTRANGGFVDSGELFVARENGMAEMVGSIGNRTAVANNDQIVAGIENGVRNAQTDQNRLLMEQNRLLAAILQKSGTVNLGASSALGRVVSQSLDMYSSLVGG